MARAADTEKATPRALGEWRRRVEAEYGSAALTQHLGLWLIRLGASPDLVHASLRITKDEIAHARLSDAVARAAHRDAGEGAYEPVRLRRETMGLRETDEPLERAVARVALDSFCLNETLAVSLFGEMRKHATAPAARRALDRIVADEVRHRDFGWALLGWLVEAGVVERAFVAAELPGALERLRASYAPPGAERQPPVSPADRAWGLAHPTRYREILEKTEARVVMPHLARLGIRLAAVTSRA